MNAMKRWMALATTEEQERLALAAGTSREYLYQMASGHRTPLSGLAARIEKGAYDLRKLSKGRLPVLLRTDLSSVCAGCPFAPSCKEEEENGEAQ